MTAKLKNNRLVVVGSLLLPFLLFSRVYAANFDRTFPKPPEGAEYVGQATCITCHDEQGQQFKRSTHSKFAIKEKDPAGQGCEACHGPGSKHADSMGETPGLILKGDNPEMCFTCHLEMKAAFNLQYHHPVLEGKVSCTDCHEPHGEEVRPWTATSLEGVNEKCFKCHPDKKGPFVWEHQATREGCTTCHNPHGTISRNLLVADDHNLCLRCHFENGFLTGHASRMSQAPVCATCHLAVHGSNFNPSFQKRE